MSRHRAPRGGGIEPAPAVAPLDPRHRPVLLYVASPTRRARRHPVPLLPTLGTALALVALLTVTLVSAWRGWEVASSDAVTGPPSSSPVVPRVLAPESDVPSAAALPGAPEPSVPFDTPPAAGPPRGEATMLEERSAQPHVITTMMTTGLPPGGEQPVRPSDLFPAPRATARTTTAATSTAAVPVSDTTTTSDAATTRTAPAVEASSTPAPTSDRSENACPAPEMSGQPAATAATRVGSEPDEDRPTPPQPPDHQPTRGTHERTRGDDHARHEEPEAGHPSRG